MNNFINYYEILELEDNATTEEIKKNFRRLAKLYHPDGNQDVSAKEKEECAKKLNLIFEAYNTLKDDLKRVEYDKKYFSYMKKNKKTTKKVNPYLQAYKEVKEEERNNSFTKRHTKLAGKIDKNFHDAIILEKGLLHICGEAIYQLSKLKKYDGSKVKYVLRNRYLIGTVIAFSTISLITPNNKKEVVIPEKVVENHPSEVDLTRIYTVKENDTLEALAADTNVDTYMIKKVNNKYNDTLYVGEKLLLHYKIPYQDLKFYTYPVKFDKNISLEEFAYKYDTTIDNLIVLNEDAIINDKGIYVVLSNYLNVPNFLTKQDLEEKKSKEKQIF